ncbi:hypothetical protein KL86CLO1_13155 [uncultured Eubacteriales bacterium]|uniref:Uncharacterized protein n=1 Tax=uncultured Eubacteriales bacterium TaxID=172733 RepID=A0A212KHK1_9FIRM|nr:hypothetical protein KL86CLO1_13155 [uncultured Eubacteriales bacterium]
MGFYKETRSAREQADNTWNGAKFEKARMPGQISRSRRSYQPGRKAYGA